MACGDKQLEREMESVGHLCKRKHYMENSDCVRKRIRDATGLLWSCFSSMRLSKGRNGGYGGGDDQVNEIERLICDGATVTDDMMVEGVSFKSAKIVKLLLCGGGDPNVVLIEEFGCLGGGTLLAYAVTKGSTDIVDMLLRAGADPDGDVERWVAPLMWAAYLNNHDAVRLLLEAGANVNQTDMMGRSALLLAAEEAGCCTVQLLLDAGADPNLADATDTTPLMVTSSYGKSYDVTVEPRRLIVELLLRGGADVNRVDQRNNTALILAAEHNMRNLDPGDNIEEMNLQIGLLIDAGANVNAVGWEGKTPLIHACKSKLYRGESVVKLLLDAGAEINFGDENGHTPLMVAIAFNTVVVVKLLIDHGADVNARSQYRGSPLMIAASEGGPVMVETLLNAGANVNVCDMRGGSALLDALEYTDDKCRRERRKSVKLLLDAGAHVNHRDQRGNTAMLMAPVRCRFGKAAFNARHGDEMMHQLQDLIKAGGNVHVVGRAGDTVLIRVCSTQMNRCEDMVNLLLDRGLDVNAKNVEGMNALMSCMWWNSYDVVGVLLSRGANVLHTNVHGKGVVDMIDLTQDDFAELAIVLMRGGVDFGVQVEADPMVHEMGKDAWEQCKWLKLQLKHMCREKIRGILMKRCPGKHIAALASLVGLPRSLVQYVGNEKRYDLTSDRWMDE